MHLESQAGRPRLAARLHTAALILAALAGALAYPLAVHSAPAPGTFAPDFALKDLDGRNQRLSEFRGEVVVLTFWSSGCGPCRELLGQLAAHSAGATGYAPRIVSVSLDADPRRASSMSRALRLDFPVLVDTGQRTGRQYEVDRLPLTFLLDREGQVRAVWREAALGPGFGDIVREVSSE